MSQIEALLPTVQDYRQHLLEMMEAENARLRRLADDGATSILELAEAVEDAANLLLDVSDEIHSFTAVAAQATLLNLPEAG